MCIPDSPLINLTLWKQTQLLTGPGPCIVTYRRIAHLQKDEVSSDGVNAPPLEGV